MKVVFPKVSKAIIPVLIGVLSFLIIYGITPLDVTNINWILAGYDETDIIQHYAGWMAYRRSDWGLPLGLANYMAVPNGTIISFTDSIPIVAIAAKMLRQVLPEPFQYFGWFVLFCYILQSIAAFKIIFSKSRDIIFSTIGTVLFSFAPIFLERAFRHTGLGAQWLILFSIYLFLDYKEAKKRKTWVGFLVLEILAIGIHPYFLPMVASFEFLCLVEDLKSRKWVSILYLAIIQALTYAFGCVIGVLGSGVNPSRTRYGFFSMNLNALFNPISCGGYTWSVLLKKHPQILGNYDGFNYLGAGVLIFVIIDALLVIFTKKVKLVTACIKRNPVLIAVCALLSMFAITNVVTFNEKTLLSVPLPDSVLNLCGIFRASSRLFYPVYYLLFVFLILILWRVCIEHKKTMAYGILLFVVVLQLFDISRCVIEKHQRMLENADYTSYLSDETLQKIAGENKYLMVDDFLADRKTLAAWAYTNDLKTFFTIANSGTYEECFTYADEYLKQLKITGEIGKNIVATTNKDLAAQYDAMGNLDVYECNNKFFVFDNTEKIINPNFVYYENMMEMRLSSLTDDAWENGVNLNKRELLFDFSVDHLKVLLSADTIYCNEKEFRIENIDFDDSGIRVTVNEDADICAYPSKIFVPVDF